MQSFQAVSSTSGGPKSLASADRYVDGANNEKRASAVAVRSGELGDGIHGGRARRGLATALPAMTQILDSFRFAPTPQGKPRAPAPLCELVDPFESAGRWRYGRWAIEWGLLRRADGVRAFGS